MTVISKPAFEPENFVIKLLNISDERLIEFVEYERSVEGQTADNFKHRLLKAIGGYVAKVDAQIFQCQQGFAATDYEQFKKCQTNTYSIRPAIGLSLSMQDNKKMAEKVETWYTFSQAPESIVEFENFVGLMKWPEQIKKKYFQGFDTPPLQLHKYPFSEQKIPFVSIDYTAFVELPFADQLPYFQGCFQGMSHNFKAFIDTPENTKALILKEILKPFKGFKFVMPNRAKSAENFKDYGIYVGRLFKAWSIILQSPDYFIDGFEDEKQKNEDEPENDQQNLKAAHYVVAFIYDCHALGKSLPDGNKKLLEEIGQKRMGKNKPSNTFYKNFNKLIRRDFNNTEQWESLLGANWRDIILQLSECPVELKKYLETKP